MAAEEAKTEVPTILGMGNPLLDISASVPSELLTRYGVTLDSAILAEEKHMPVYQELVDSYEPDYIAGGATQNSIRVAQWMLGDKAKTAYIGCIGDDDFGRQLREAATADGVQVHYQVDAESATGTCAVLINNTERSLIANLAAANKYQLSHFESEEMQAVLASADIVYSSGFFLTVSPDSMIVAGKHCAENGKVYAINLAAPFIPPVCAEALANVLPYADYVFGNESEAASWAAANGMEGASSSDVALAIAKLPKANGSRGRTVVITHGSEPTIVCTEGKIRTFPCVKLAKEAIVDQNGAGDGFVGGFFTQLVQGQSLDECVRCGQFAARVVLCASGCQLPAERPVYSWTDGKTEA